MARIPDLLRLALRRLADVTNEVNISNHFKVVDSFDMPGLRFDSIRGVWSMRVVVLLLPLQAASFF